MRLMFASLSQSRGVQMYGGACFFSAAAAEEEELGPKDEAEGFWNSRESEDVEIRGSGAHYKRQRFHLFVVVLVCCCLFF